MYVLCHIWYVTHNIFIFTTQAPENLEYEICQGAARRLIGVYKAYKGHSKTLPKNRFLVGLFTARVFDLQAAQAIQKSTSKESLGNVAGGYGVPLYGNNRYHMVTFLIHMNAPLGLMITLSLSTALSLLWPPTMASRSLKIELLKSLVLTSEDAGMMSTLPIVLSGLLG